MAAACEPKAAQRPEAKAERIKPLGCSYWASHTKEPAETSCREIETTAAVKSSLRLRPLPAGGLITGWPFFVSYLLAVFKKYA